MVPLYVLRVPVRYYPVPPPYFQGWQRTRPPRWGERWGPDWNDRHRDWDRWDRRAVPARAPLPNFQRQYSGARYPAPEQQPQILGRNYRYEPREAVVRQHYEVQRVRPQAAPPTVRARDRDDRGSKGNDRGKDRNDKGQGSDKRRD
jgi:hypothetical protein